MIRPKTLLGFVRRSAYVFTATWLIALSTMAIKPQNASASWWWCGGGSGWWGRAWNCGYFRNAAQSNRWDYVWPGGFNNWGIWTLPQFIDTVRWGIWQGDQHIRIASEFYVLSMLHYPAGTNPDHARNVIDEWTARVWTYGNLGNDGTTWWGTNGYVNMRFWQWNWTNTCRWGNTGYMWQVPGGDVGAATSTDVNCAYNTWWDAVVFFRNDGQDIYRIDRHCGNVRWVPNGVDIWGWPSPDLRPSVNSTVNGVGSSIASPGDTVRFSLGLWNAGGSGTAGTTRCASYANVYAGRRTASAWDGWAGGPGGPGVGCPTDPGPGWGAEVGWDQITIGQADLGKSICRTLTVWPAWYNAVGGRFEGVRSYEGCITVMAKPYTQTFGGDVSVGGGIQSASVPCTNVNAQIKAWNRGSGYGYAGAGTDYAAFAMGNISQYATAQGYDSTAMPATPAPYLAQYWNYSGAPNFPGGAPTYQTTTPVVDYDWGGGGPGNGVWNDFFMGRWTRDINFASGNYTFNIVADDGVRLYIDGALVLDRWIDQVPTTYAVSRYLTTGSHNIRFEFYEHGGGAVAKLSFVRTSVGPAVASAPPKGLSFSNTAGDSTYGGAFGKVDCIQDYYSRRLLANPATVIDPGSSVNNISSFQDGKTYIHNGDFTITSGGNTNPNQRTEVYVNGNVYIGGNITYNGSSWNMNKLPLLSIVATGNIYIGSGVSRLDGLYVAQGTGNRGIIYTCATGMGAPVDPRGGGWYSACNRKLTVNGAFVAQRVELLRTFGDLANAQATDTSDSNGNGTNSAEVFNYNPAMWMIGPLNGSGKTDNYDAITSLPPVL